MPDPVANETRRLLLERLFGRPENQNAVQAPLGLVRPGTIDPTQQPSVPVPQSEGGGNASVRTIGVGAPQGEMVVPTVSVAPAAPRLVPDEEAIKLAFLRNLHLGVFDTPKHATAFADSLHRREEARGGKRPPRIP